MNEVTHIVNDWLMTNITQVLLIGAGVALGNFVNDFLQRRRN